jgi:hypothetical protein
MPWGLSRLVLYVAPTRVCVCLLRPARVHALPERGCAFQELGEAAAVTSVAVARRVALL